MTYDPEPRRKGERSPRAKITEDQAIAILKDKRSLRDIGEAFGLSVSAVNNIKLGLSWSHLDRSEVHRSPRGGNWRSR